MTNSLSAATLGAVSGQFDVVFIVDSHWNVGTRNWDITKQFVIDVVAALDVSDNKAAVRVGVISYATFIENAVVLGDYSGKAELQVWLNGHCLRFGRLRGSSRATVITSYRN